MQIEVLFSEFEDLLVRIGVYAVWFVVCDLRLMFGNLISYVCACKFG